MMKDKKGISPLIATVLIIGFTIVLAAVVMQWGGSFVRGLTEEQATKTEVATECLGLSFDINNAKVVSKARSCEDNADCDSGDTCTSGVCDSSTDQDKISFKVTSNSDKIIGSFIALLNKGTDTESLSTEVLNCEVAGFSTKTCEVNLGSTIVESNDKLKLIPMVSTADGNKPCTADAGKEHAITL